MNQGESLLVDGNVNAGETVTANQRIQVTLLTGDVCATYESRFYTLRPEEQWSNNYYNPVATHNGDPTFVFLYNNESSAINVEWETSSGVQGTISVPAGGVNHVQIPNNTGSFFYSVGGENFYAIATIDSDPSQTTDHDWGFALIPSSQLSSQITMVGFAPGQDPTYCTSTNVISKAAWSIQYLSLIHI